VELRRLHNSDDRKHFQSGDPDLDRFFHGFAGQNQFRHHVGVTYVAVEDQEVLGYATVAPAAVEIDLLPDALRKGLPRYPLPVLRLARLAVDSRVRGRGLGEELLRFVFGLALKLTSEYGCVGVVVDAKPDAVSFYARFGFGAIELVEGGSDARPRPTPMFLPTSELTAALRAPRRRR
jgi:GNAT superfamily N-acetyltransferase